MAKIEKTEEVGDSEESEASEYTTEESEEIEITEESEEADEDEEDDDEDEEEDDDDDVVNVCDACDGCGQEEATLVYDNSVYDEFGENKVANVEKSEASKVDNINTVFNYNNFNKLQDEYEEKKNNMVYLILNHTKNIRKASLNLNLKKHPINKKVYKFYNRYNGDEKKYFDILPESDKNNLVNIEEELENSSIITEVPIRFKILNSNINVRTKKNIITKIENFNKMSSHSSEYNKLSSWLLSLNNIPFNKFYEIPIKITDGREEICGFLNSIRLRMDETIFGHKDAKEQIVRILAQLISFPKASGYIIGIQGSAGVGKTKLIKEGICNALNYPNAFISLSGTDDSSFLKGHSYTYEGSSYGKICETLMKTGIMNPLILFDELDKVSNTYKGQEIINTLIHITDPVQNDKFNDRYFEEIDFDISRSMIIFTYNDDSLINPILRDRMIVINVNGYNTDEKVLLAKDYIIPEILKQYNLNKGDILFTEELIKHIINDIEKEEGVRNLKRAINDIVSWCNMMLYVPTDSIKISMPFSASKAFYDTYCKKKSNLSCNKFNSLYL